MKLWRAAVAAWRAPVSTSQRRNPSRSYLCHSYVGIRAAESPTRTAQKAAPTHMRMARAEAGCVRSACRTRSRTMAIRLTLLTTEWLLLHCEAHTAELESVSSGRFRITELCCLPWHVVSHAGAVAPLLAVAALHGQQAGRAGALPAPPAAGPRTWCTRTPTAQQTSRLGCGVPGMHAWAGHGEHIPGRACDTCTHHRACARAHVRRTVASR